MKMTETQTTAIKNNGTDDYHKNEDIDEVID